MGRYSYYCRLYASPLEPIYLHWPCTCIMKRMNTSHTQSLFLLCTRSFGATPGTPSNSPPAQYVQLRIGIHRSLPTPTLRTQNRVAPTIAAAASQYPTLLYCRPSSRCILMADVCEETSNLSSRCVAFRNEDIWGESLDLKVWRLSSTQ
jgi:hypothetical protein